MSDAPGRVSIVDFDPDAHKLMLADWLRHAHVRLWWGDPADNLHQAIVPEAGLGQGLIVVGDTPVGYLRWQPLSRTTLAAIRLPDPPDVVIDIDVFIGDPVWRGRSIAAAALHLLSRRLLADPAVGLLVLCTSVENHAAVRACEKAGFVRSVQYEDSEWGPCWVMVYPGPPAAA